MTELAPRSVRATMIGLAREHFSLFVAGAFRQLNEDEFLPNWHVDAIAWQLEQMAAGTTKRLIITMPPRTMKSFCGNVCFPAWLLGRNPAEKIICASYSQDLSQSFARDMRTLMQSAWYKRVFPATRLDPKSLALDEMRTTRGGSRLSTSTGGTLTGRGANYIIVDDAIKAQDAHSLAERERAINWFNGAVTSRLNNPSKGRILVIGQRLHLEDLPGQLIAAGGWQELCLPLVAHQPQDITVSADRIAKRPPGSILHPERFSHEWIKRQRAEMGGRDFEAQYNQRPQADGGTLFKLEWLQRYSERPAVLEVQGIFQSWDTAYEVAAGNDYSVCSTWALCAKRYFLLEVYRARLQFPDLEKAIYAQKTKWAADVVIVEKAGSGLSVWQNIRRAGKQWIQSMPPVGSKQDRASQQSSKLERGEVYVPTEAPWLKAFEDELVSFPQSKFDDQVDSIVQFLAAVDTGRLPFFADQARAW